MRKTAPSSVLGLALAMAAASSLAATTYYMPVPDTGGGNLVFQIQIQQAKGGPNQLTPVFLPANISASGLSGTPTNVNNFFRPNVFDVTNLITSGGVLRLDGAAGIAPVDGSVLVNKGGDNTAWDLPILTAGDFYPAGSNAHLSQMARNTSGGVTHLQILNGGTATANCSIQLQRPKGSPVGDPFPLSVPAGSSAEQVDVLGHAGYTGAGGIRATISCDQAFWPFATFATPDRVSVQVKYPSAKPPLPPGPTVRLDLPRRFFKPVLGNSELTLDLPLVPNTSYRSVTIDFDMAIGDKWDFVFDVVLGMFHKGGPRFNKTLYFGTFIRGLRQRYVIDMGQPVLEVDLKRGTSLQLTGNYHIHIVYDTEHQWIDNQILDTRGNLLFDYQGGTFNNDLADRGNPVQLNFGVGGIADFAYFPPIGWAFSNLHAVAQR
jgi:hypothetical protein